MRALGWVAVVLTVACSEPPSSSPSTPRRVVPPLTAFAAPKGFTRLRFGLVPFLSAETMKTSHAQLADYLAARLGVPVELVVGSSYDDTVTRAEKGEVELIELSPYAYAKASRQLSLRCLAQSIADGSPSTSGYLFVRDDSALKGLEELKGTRLALVDRSSTSGYLYPMKLFKDRGLAPTSFASVELLGNHEAVLLAVLEGKADVGATYQGAFWALWRAKGVDPLSFRVIAKTPRTPREIFCVVPSVPQEVADAVGNALRSLSARDRAGREILGPLHMNGFLPADDRAYDEVRAVAKELEAP